MIESFSDILIFFSQFIEYSKLVYFHTKLFLEMKFILFYFKTGLNLSEDK